MSAALKELQRRLLERAGRGAKYGLERLHTALAALGDPHRDLPVVHVAGTNGKGSVCAMVESVALEAGLRAGTYTSPHLCRLAERIRLDGAPIQDDAFADALARVLHPSVPYVTFFEGMTLAAMLAMHRAEVDLAILEVGLGGRLDATNVIPRALATGIVSVGLDHVRILGDDVAQIAREKAGIFKADTPAVIGPLGPRARRAALAQAEAVGASPIWRCAPGPSDPSDGVVGFDDDGLVMLPDGRRIDSPRLGLVGPHQRQNAAVATALVALAGDALDRDLTGAIPAGLASAAWPGRIERIARDGVAVVLDCAHNADGARALRAALSPEVTPERCTLVFGAMGDKAWPEMVDTLAPLAHRRVYAPPIEALAGRLPAPTDALAARHPGAIAPDPEAAIRTALDGADEGDTVLVAGSIFLVGAVRAALLGIERDVSVPL